MTDAERRKAFNQERRAQLLRGVRIQSETYDEIVYLLEQAKRTIAGELALGAPTGFESWRLQLVQAEIRRNLAVFERGTLASILTGLDRSHEAGGDLVLQPLRAAGIDITSVVPALDPRLLIAMKSFQTDRIRDISTTVVNRVNTELGQVAIGVQSPFEAARKVAEHLDAPKARAATIVRTELGTIYSEAGQQRMEQAVKAGVAGLEKQWRRSGKLHPRVTHELADGQIKPVDQPFLVGGIEIMKPRDPALPAKERINCGCSSLPHMKHWRVKTPGARPYTAEELEQNVAARQVEEIRAATPALDQALSRARLLELRASLAQTSWGRALAAGDRRHGLTDEEALALHAYTFRPQEAGAAAVNDALRAGGAPAGTPIARLVAVQKAALEKLPDYRGAVERRVESVPADLAAAADRLDDGPQEWSDPGFLSASARPSIFRREFRRARQRISIESRTGRDISMFSTFDQAEIIFAPGVRFRLVRYDVDRTTGRARIRLEEIG